MSITIFLLASRSVFGQPEVPKSEGPGNNKSVGICKMYSDSIKIDEIRCGEITVDSKNPVTITSFYFSYYKQDNMTLESLHIFGNTLKPEDLEKLKQIRPKRVYIQEILGESTEGILILGNRDIYLN